MPPDQPTIANQTPLLREDVVRGSYALQLNTATEESTFHGPY
jgi:hypothetical protein